jgi:capsular exopolysaccharide synthesis family protein
MATLKDQVDSAQKKLAEFQEANDIIGTAGGLNDGNTVTDRLRILNQSLATAESDRIEKEARLRAAATADPSVLATLFPDATLNALQASQVELQGRAAQLSSKFGPKYPPLAEVNKQLTAINLQVMQSEGAVRQRLQQEYDAAKAVQDMLQKEYAAQTQVAFGVNRNQAEYAVLQGDVTTSRELYDLLRRKMQQASVDADISGLKTVPVDASRIPTEPVAPKRLLILLGSAILGLFAGVAAAFVGEATSDQVQTRRQVEADLGIPVLALLPRDGGPVSSLVTLRRSSSRDAEAYRALRTAVLAMPSAKSIMVASSLPNEGLGRVVANLAVSLAQAGHRVLAVDTDLRSPSLHNEFDIDNNAGLSNVLMNEDVKGALLHPLKDLGDLSLLPAGPPIAFPSERLSSEFFRALLKSWENDFDFVILQAAPLLIVSDGVSVAGLADSVLLIARHEVTRLSNLTQVKLLLDRSSARVRGVVIGDVPAVNMDYASYEKVGNAYFA